MPETLFLFDHPESVAAWSAIDDRVMGGVSRSALRFDAAGHAVFSGQVSPDNNGGFASARGPLVPELGSRAAGATALRVRALGGGKNFVL